MARRPAVLVEVLGAAHRVPALDAALGHAVLALQLRGAPRLLLAPPHARQLAPLPAAERVGASGALGAAVERLGAEHAAGALGRARQRLGALELGAVVVGGARGGRGRLQRGAVALVVTWTGCLGRGRGRVGLVSTWTVFLLGVVGVVPRVAAPGPLGLVGAGGGGVTMVSR